MRWLTLYLFVVSVHGRHHRSVIMPPIPSSSFIAAPSASTVSLPATQPTELELAGLIHTSPGLFWFLVSVFAFAFALGATWAGIEWRRRVGLRAGGDGKKTRSRRSRWKRTRAAKEEDDLEANKEEVHQDVYGSQNQAWAPPERTSSLAELYYAPCLDPALDVPPPPHKHGLPLAIIQEEVEEDAVDVVNSNSHFFKHQYDGKRADSETEAMWTPSVMINTSPSPPNSSSSLAYLSARSPLSTFVIELSLAPLIPAPSSTSTPSLALSTQSYFQVPHSPLNTSSSSSPALENVISTPLYTSLNADPLVRMPSAEQGREFEKENRISSPRGKVVGSGRITWEETSGSGTISPKDKKRRQPFGTTNVKTMPSTAMEGYPREA